MDNARCLILAVSLLVLLAGPVLGGEEACVAERIEKWLTAEFPEPHARWETWILSNQPSPARPVKQTLQVVGQAKPKKIMNFIYQPDAQSPARAVRVRVVKYVRVPVARKVIYREKSLQANDWAWEERNAEQVPRDALRQEQALVNVRTRKVLTRKEIITQHAVELEPDVKAGQILTLRVQGQGVVLRAEARSLKDGRRGDWVPLKSNSSGCVVQAQVTGPGAAEIHLLGRQP